MVKVPNKPTKMSSQSTSTPSAKSYVEHEARKIDVLEQVFGPTTTWPEEMLAEGKVSRLPLIRAVIAKVVREVRKGNRDPSTDPRNVPLDRIREALPNYPDPELFPELLEGVALEDDLDRGV